MKVAFDTDVNIVAAFEYYHGDHNVHESLAYVTIGTGIGVGLVINGKMVHGLVHPEGGHIRVPLLKEDEDYEGVCIFHKNCLEGLCTNVSIAKRLNKTIDDLKDVEDNNSVWDKIGYYIGLCCANLSLTLSVEKIVLGGGVMERKVLL
jgi:fructokinase